MDKASFSFVVRTRDSAAGSFAVNSGPVVAGANGRVGLRVERVENLYEFTRAPCQLVLYEVDGSGRRWNRATEIARFNVAIRREGLAFFFTVNGRIDTPTYENRLPPPTQDWEHWYQEPWKVKRVFRGPWAQVPIRFDTGYRHGWKPPWQPPHVVLDFNTSGATFDRATTVVIPRSCRLETAHHGHVTDHFYTIGFRVLVGGAVKYQSLTLPVDCSAILAHNLGVAAKGMLYAHDEMIYQHWGATVMTPNTRPPAPALMGTPSLFSAITGTHYGTSWVKDAFVAHHGRRFGAPQARFVYQHARRQRLHYISCMEYPLQVGQIGFEKTFSAPPHRPGARPRSPLWAAYRNGLPKAHATFVPIIKALVRAGWTTVYFNPDAQHPAYCHGDLACNRHHLTAARLALREPGTYHGIQVHDRMVDYKLPVDCPHVLTAEERNRVSRQRAQLARLPFAFIITSGQTGVEHFAHCALPADGMVYEVHYDQGPDHFKLFDRTPFET